jgi:AcrR family transcriptional regulator
MPRDERRAQILGAAATAFAESGFAATSMADVARAAGITKLIVYRHFDSKADLYREILEQVARRLADEWLTVSDVEHSGGHSARVLLAAARAHPDGFRLLFVHAPREPEFASYHADFRAIQIDLADRLFAPYVEEALIRDWLCRQAVDHLVAAVLNWIDVAEPSDDERFADLATDGIVAMARAATR